MLKRISRYFQGTFSQLVAGCLLAIAVVVMLEASVFQDGDCSRGWGWSWDLRHAFESSGDREIALRCGRDRLTATLRGEIEFTADERAVRRLSPGAYLEIGEKVAGERRRLEVRPGDGGEPEYSWFIDREAADFDDRARDWMQASLLRLFRVGGFDVEARVGRLLAAGGVAFVLFEVPEIRGDHAQALYLEQARLQAEMESDEIPRWLETAGRYVGSDFELGRLLSELPAAWFVDGSARAAFVSAAHTVGSDFELRHALEALVSQGDLTPQKFALVLEAATTIGSDYELAALLIRAVESATQEPPPTFFGVVATVGSDYEHRRVLAAVAERPQLGADTLRRVLESSLSIGSDFEQAGLLLQLSQVQSIHSDVRPDFERALAGVGSRFERQRVLEALADDSQAEVF